MDVSVGGVVLQRRYEPVEVKGRNVLRGGPDYICGRKRAGHRPTIGWAGLSSLRSVIQIRAEKHNDDTRHVMLAEMDVSLRHSARIRCRRADVGIDERKFKSSSFLVQV